MTEPLANCTVILVRHGQPVGVRPKSFLGHADPPLGSDGIAQAHRAAAWIIGAVGHNRFSHPVACISSDLQRARETAEPIATTCSLAVQCDQRLREIDFGRWDGKTFVEVDKAESGAATEWFTKPAEEAPHGGESLAEVHHRVGELLHEIEQQYAQQVVCLVGHFGSLAMAAAHLLGIEPVAALRVVLQRGQVGVIAHSALRYWGVPAE